MAGSSAVEPFQRLQSLVANPLDPSVRQRRWFAGIIGDRPSQHAKSPSLWNAAFRGLGIDAAYLAFDVDPPMLSEVVRALRACEGFLGGSVTNPYKVAIVPLLDELDPQARRIGAVNTIVRRNDGRLIGANTDGQGFLDMLVRPFPDTPEPFLPRLTGARAVLMGAGGAARAVAFFLAEAIGASGSLAIVNRDEMKARELAAAVSEAYGNATATATADLGKACQEATLVINATTKGQAGLRRSAAGVSCLEPYAALAPANPAWVPEAENEVATFARWYAASRPDIVENWRLAAEVVANVPNETAFVDLIYAPPETAMLRLARWSGHSTLNGRRMNIAQAVGAFVNWVMAPHLGTLGLHPELAYARVFEEMARVW